ncbi:MAG: hypothetical protein ACM3UU_06825 [Ignavibacteriales bacterium]
MNILVYTIGYDLLGHYKLRKVDKDITGQYKFHKDWTDKIRKLFSRKLHQHIPLYVIVRIEGNNLIISSITEEKLDKGFNETDFGALKENEHFDFEYPKELLKFRADSTWYKNIYDYVALAIEPDGNLIIIPDGKSSQGNLLIDICIVEPVKNSFYIQLDLMASGVRGVRQWIKIED